LIVEDEPLIALEIMAGLESVPGFDIVAATTSGSLLSLATP